MQASVGPDRIGVDAVMAQLVRVSDQPALDEAMIGFEMELKAEDPVGAERLVREVRCLRESRRTQRDAELIAMPVENGHSLEFPQR